MRIDRLKLMNFKGFSELDQRLNCRFTLIVGDNGVGKSSLLDALSIAFGSFFLGVPDVARRHINQSEVREFEREFDGAPEFNHAYPVVVEAEGRITHPVSGEVKDLCWTRALGSKNGRTTTKDARALSSIAGEAYQAVKDLANPTLPLLSYYGTGRLWVEPKAVKRKARPSRFDAYRNSHEPRVSPADLLNWLRRERLRELETERSSSLLTAWRKAVEACFDERVEVTYSPSRERLEVRFVSRGQTIAYENLSHGQRNILSMVGDIAFKATILNPHLGAEAVSAVQGTVLIDEIDLHLHPRWQRIVVPALLEAFPNLQFVATTHSPFIIQSLSEGVLLDLNEMELDDRVHNLPLREIVEGVQKVETSDRSASYLRKMRSAQNYLGLVEKQATLAGPDERAKLEAELDEMEGRIQDPGLEAMLKIERLAKSTGR
ncbi:MAG: AAA family ATPase [Boseongicola sp. SB0675_bin_26]|nr:AAA family ATPase [Boseongicola sp. SB0675_bin_26]